MAPPTNQLGSPLNGIDPQDADLVLSTLRHQRDLFSGPLGIPDVTTRVGSVIHAFETMARQRQTLGGRDKPYDSMATGTGTAGGGSAKYRSHRSNVKRVGDANRHKIILPSPKLSPSSSANAGQLYHGQQFHSASYQPASSSLRQYNPPHHHLPPASFSYTDPLGVRRHASTGGGGGGLGGEENIHINNNNFEQNLPHSGDDQHSQSLPRTMFPASVSVSGTNTITAGPAVDQGEIPHFQLNNDHESSNFDSLNLDDDYRKSSFGKQSKLLHQHQQHQQHQQLFPRRNQPPNTLLLARTQQSSGNQRTGRGLWSLFGGASNNPSEPSNHHSTPSAGYSTSRNNPNVFFNATERGADMTVAATAGGSIAPLQLSTAPTSSSTGTMRYYNHDNNVNSANRRTVPAHLGGREETVGPSAASTLREGGRDEVPSQRYEGDASIANEGDNEATDNHVSGDKFLRGTTVSQSFIKNVRIIGKKSSSYDVSGANNTNHRKDTKKRNESIRSTAAVDGTSSSSNGFKHRGSLMMAAAAKHFTKRNRAPQPTSTAAPVVPADTDELTGPKPPAEDVATNNGDDNSGLTGANETGPPSAKGSTGPPMVQARVNTTGTGTSSNRRALLFQPRTIDRAEI
uniref:Uncharacterized protein n=1 Tax=Anopheles stephensi TaxID=30069 RepID=A0A182XX39_ANOST